MSQPGTDVEGLLARQAEMLRQREHDLAVILDNMPAMIGYWDRQLRNRFGNYAYHDWFGIDPQTMRGMHIREVIGEERFRLNLPYIEAALRGERQQFERAIPTPDGSAIRYSLAEYIPDIHDGQVHGFFVLVTDVTRLKLVESALRDSETRFRTLFEDSSEPALLWEDGVFVDCNAAAARLLALPRRKAARGLSFDSISPLEQPDGQASAPHMAAKIAAATECGHQLFEWECQRADGIRLTVEIRLTSIQADRCLLHVVLHDVTAAKAMERELLRSNVELESFAYAASHDLRQPLRMIASFLGLLERKIGAGLDEDGRSFMNFAVDGARRLDRMIVALLDYSRIGRHGHQKENVHLAQAVERAVQSLGQVIAEAGAEVRVCGPLPCVSGFASELDRLFQNLLANAVKFRAPGRVPQVAVQCREDLREWILSVSDNGIGVPADQQARLFTVFYRVAREAEYEGAGIGLASCRKIVERHGGRIWIESEEGRGTTVLVALPKGALPE